MRGDTAGYRGSMFRGRGPFCPRSYNCSSDHCAGLLPGVQITVGSAVASSGSARTSAAVHLGPVQVELRPHSDASARTCLEGLVASAREHRRLMQKGVIVDL